MSETVGFDIIGMDVVEVAPIYDYSEITSLLAAHVIFEMLAYTRRKFVKIRTLSSRNGSNSAADRMAVCRLHCGIRPHSLP
jgi:hypothetical protein